jgi:hypothetical protein
LETLTTVLDSLDGVAEPLRGYYREEDGRFVLSLAEPKAHPAFRTLKQTADRLDRELKEARRSLDGANERLAAWPDEFEREEFARLKERGNLDDGKIERRAAKRRRQEMDKALERADAAERQLHTLLVENGLTTALSQAQVAPSLLDAAKALLLRQHKAEIVDGRALIDGDEIPDFVKSWADGEAGRHFVAAPQSGGGGAEAKPGGTPSAGTANPFAKGQGFNLTEQMRLRREDPARAERLRQAAGIKGDGAA